MPQEMLQVQVQMIMLSLRVGGLVGEMGMAGSITASYATGDVTSDSASFSKLQVD